VCSKGNDAIWHLCWRLASSTTLIGSVGPRKTRPSVANENRGKGGAYSTKRVGRISRRRNPPPLGNRKADYAPLIRPTICGNSSALRLVQLRQQIAQIERIGEHPQAAVLALRPHLLGPVPIKLDAVVVGVAQVERLADAVVGGAFERDFCGDQPAERVGQKPAGRVEDGRGRWCPAPAARRRGSPRC
jgi:hypothetical protein